jgi:NADH-quinone oxidoreductase subunit N
VLQAVVQVDMWGLALYAVIMSVIGAFYYLRVVKLMYFDEAQLDAPLRGPMDVNIVLGANGLLMLGLGLFPGGLMALCAAAIVW